MACQANPGRATQTRRRAAVARYSMIPKSGTCFSQKIMRREEHDPEKRDLLFAEDHAS